MTVFGELLRKWSRARGLSDTAMALSLNVKKSTYAAWVSGTNTPSLRKYVEICKRLEVSPGLPFPVPPHSDNEDRRALHRLADEIPDDKLGYARAVLVAVKYVKSPSGPALPPEVPKPVQGAERTDGKESADK